MKPVRSEWTIVLVGSWNAAIFSPEWVGQNVFRQEQVEIEFGVGPSQGHLKYRSDSTELVVRPDRLIFSPRHRPWEQLEALETQAVVTLETLQHTPVSSFGVNFGYRINAPQEPLTRLFDLVDLAGLGDAGAAVAGTLIQRRMRLAEVNLNLRHQFDNGMVSIHCNFHHDVPSAGEAAAALRGKPTLYHRMAVNLIHQVYAEDEENEEADA